MDDLITHPELLFSAELLDRYPAPGARYSSYPTPDRFHEAFSEQDYALTLRQRSSPVATRALSLYIHIPFCASQCSFCSLSTVITPDRSQAVRYLDYLGREMALQAARLGGRQKVSQLQIGGGTPTFFSDDELAQLMGLVRQHFDLSPLRQCSMEIDPRTVDYQRLQALKALGFNCLSLGVQDLDPAVQKAVHRNQSAEQVVQVFEGVRALGFAAVNMDLMYGLPLQTAESFDRTLVQVLALRPDRIALYSYHHQPQQYKAQRRIAEQDLPDNATKTAMLARWALRSAGYVHVGIDHFALPDDALAVAKRQGRLFRNFQGYCTQPDCDLIALGVSAIGRMATSYSQNASTLDAYYDALDHDRLPVVRGLVVSRDDQMRRTVILALMCHGYVDFEDLSQAVALDFAGYFAKELEELKAMAQDGLVVVEEQAVRVTAVGDYFLTVIASVFDRYRRTDRMRLQLAQVH